jgi:hypothetical protein
MPYRFGNYVDLEAEFMNWPKVSFLAGGTAPDRLLALRRQTFVHERRLLTDEALTSDNDAKGCHLLVESDDGATVLGATHIMLAEDSDFWLVPQICG